MRPQDLLDRLAAGYEYDPMYGSLCNERDQLKAENAKLRELIFDMLVDEERGHNDDGTFYEHVRLAKELGIEVGE